METPSADKRRSMLHQVCDTCHARKVRCDRQNPCGNCQDQGTVCTRHRSIRRTLRKVSRQNERASSANRSARTSIQPLPETGPLHGLFDQQTDTFSLASEIHTDGLPMEMPEVGPILNNHSNVAYEFHSWISIVPLSDAQMSSRHQLSQVQGLAWNRLQALESALYAASQVTESMGGLGKFSNTNDQSEELYKIPSPEFLSWMLKDIGTNQFGSYIQDYFRHVSKQTLEKMGLSLLRRDASPADSILYTVCVNSIAYKSITTVLMTEENTELTQQLWQNALQYRATAQAALKRIPLVTTPSFTLLQAVICGIFLFQESGDTTFCWELTRTACRICTDIRLNTTATSGQGISEEEYYCFIWCYILDRNYAWKLGRSKCFLDVVPEDISHASARVNPHISELLFIYLDLAQIQDGIKLFIRDPSTESQHVAPPLINVRERLLPKMEDIRGRIDQLASPSDSWKGLDRRSEVAALDYAYYSVMTTILHLVQLTPGQTLSAKDLYLDSARQALSALVSICLSSDKQSTVAFLHWTLLYYPLTAAFVLFCNTVVNSHIGDFNLLKTVADCLAQCGTISQNISKLQKLFQEFVSLLQQFLHNENSTIFTNQETAQTSPTLQHGITSQNIGRHPNSPRWMSTSSTWSTDILTGLDEHPFDQAFPMLGLSYEDSNFFLSSGPDVQPFSSV
ncbi:hypothetical protein BBP40_010475 [Aspergillus hancockii]|nr:hypothetical protein BBP40_010475 [Aspergillus hancockii]